MFLKKTDFVYPDKSKPNDLSTFFIYPHLLFSKQLTKTMSKIDAKDLIHDYIENRGKILILGGDQTGKTTLAKKYFEDIFSSNKLLPIYINCTESVPRAYDNLIDENFKHQYGQKYSKEFKDNIVLIVDNFNLCKTSWQEEFIKKNSPNVIIFANSTFFDDLKKRTLLKDFSYYEIKTLGHEKRGELINKWIAFMDEEDKNYQVFDDLNQFVNQTLLSGLIPYTPFYVLTILLAKKKLYK